MKTILSIDLGCTTTKILAMTTEAAIIGKLQVKTAEPVLTLYGAIGAICHEYQIDICEVQRIVLTGAGASWIEGDLYHIPTSKVDEVQGVGLGALYLAKKEEAVVMNLGTGTTFIHASKKQIAHLGGTGLGGGMLTGLSKQILGLNDIHAIHALAEKGDLKNVDLLLCDIYKSDFSFLPPNATAANLAHIKEDASDADLALGLINMVFQTLGTLAGFTYRNTGLKEIIVTGSMAFLPLGKKILNSVGELYGYEFISIEDAPFTGCIGAFFAHERTSSYSLADKTKNTGKRL